MGQLRPLFHLFFSFRTAKFKQPAGFKLGFSEWKARTLSTRPPPRPNLGHSYIYKSISLNLKNYDWATNNYEGFLISLTPRQWRLSLSSRSILSSWACPKHISEHFKLIWVKRSFFNLGSDFCEHLLSASNSKLSVLFSKQAQNSSKHFV